MGAHAGEYSTYATRAVAPFLPLCGARPKSLSGCWASREGLSAKEKAESFNRCADFLHWHYQNNGGPLYLRSRP